MPHATEDRVRFQSVRDLQRVAHAMRQYLRVFEAIKIENNWCPESLGLLGDTLAPTAVARFPRHCPGPVQANDGEVLSNLITFPGEAQTLCA